MPRSTLKGRSIRDKPIKVPSSNPIHWIYSERKKLGAIKYLSNEDFEPSNLVIDTKLFQKLQNLKRNLETIPKEKLEEARRNACPLANLGNFGYVSRGALKLADIDESLQFSLCSEPESHFTDICSGPGGFSQYLLKKSNGVRGIGFTLKDHLDFKFEDERFKKFYGVAKDGDIYNPENIKSLHAFVMEETENRGSDLVLADGGFSVQGRENDQETLSHQLYFCQMLSILLLTKIGGTAIMKFFDISTISSTSIVYILLQNFAKVSLFKPISSRAANSERYLLCIDRLDSNECIKRLFDIAEQMFANRCGRIEVENMSPAFLSYLFRRNVSLCSSQILALQRVFTGTRNENRGDLKKYYKNLWRLRE
ncbi:unnamed protein product [Euphydryas editha]|uniref:Cap-specific mRNA (nucleoside-2'-O-)-methyltransferase 1 n=1 Tax=Euphydryas editha TaxID=104508 RepID=A0AAU9UPV6_EUPED|nr:unnamed protein product [Euphydryas editha]